MTALLSLSWEVLKISLQVSSYLWVLCTKIKVVCDIENDFLWTMRMIATFFLLLEV